MHWIILPVVLPALLAPLIGFVMRHDITLARTASVAGTVVLLAIALGLTAMAADGTTHVYRLGDWPAPFGIVLVLDRLSALMVLLTSTLALIVLIHAITTGWDARGRHFHALFQFQLMGICGAFLTGDIFNLFVFFEVLLIASYGLMIHSGGKDADARGPAIRGHEPRRFDAVPVRAGHALCLHGHAEHRRPRRAHPRDPAEEAALVRVAAILLMIVFAVKAALFPVQFWLPATYANAPAPGGGAFRDHDQGRRLRDPARPYDGLRARQPGDRGSGRHVAVPGGHRDHRGGRLRRARARDA
jgi:multicomponent K+:H+ antiporter subunit D